MPGWSKRSDLPLAGQASVQEAGFVAVQRLDGQGYATAERGALPQGIGKEFNLPVGAAERADDDDGAERLGKRHVRLNAADGPPANAIIRRGEGQTFQSRRLACGD